MLVCMEVVKFFLGTNKTGDYEEIDSDLLRIITEWALLCPRTKFFSLKTYEFRAMNMVNVFMKY